MKLKNYLTEAPVDMARKKSIDDQIATCEQRIQQLESQIAQERERIESLRNQK